MPKPYSIDFRRKVATAVNSGSVRPSRLAKSIGIAGNTIWLWIKQDKESGDLPPKPGTGRGMPPKIKDLERFRKIVDENPDANQARPGEIYGGVSASAAGRAMKKIGYTRKKKVLRTESGTRKREKHF